MNILFVCHDQCLSGANLSLIDWVKNSDKKNNYVFLIPRYNKEFIKMVESFGAKVIVGNYMVSVKHLYKIGTKMKIKSFVKWLGSNTINYLNLCILSKKIKKLNIDIIHSNSFAVYFGAQLAKFLSIPHVWHIREFMEEDHQITHYNKKRINKLVEYSHAIFISPVVEEYYKKFKFKSGIVIYDKIEYENNYEHSTNYFNNNYCNIIMVGTISKNKGQLEAIKAIELVQKKGYKVKLSLCGIGDYIEMCKKYIKDNNINNVNFLGHRTDVIEIRKKMDIALVCSKKEALGRVTIEAMYYENFVIGADTGCTPLIVENKKTGLLYKSGSCEDLAEKIIYAIDSFENIKTIIKKAKNYAILNFSNEISSKIFDLYSMICN